MTQKRIIGGQESMAGEVVRKLHIGQPISLIPLKYETTCSGCGTVRNVAHAALRNGSARCLNNGCGKNAVLEAATETLAQYRQRLSSQERKREFEKQARSAEAQRQAEQEITSASLKIAEAVRERITKIPDEELYISPEVASIRMTQDEARQYNASQAAVFMHVFREYDAYKNDSNLNALADYFERNGVKLATAEMIRRAFIRLRDCGLLIPNRVIALEPVRTPVQRLASVATAVQQSKADDLPAGSEKGYDLTTGEQRPYSKREIDALSANQFRRVFRVYRDVLTLPNRIW